MKNNLENTSKTQIKTNFRLSDLSGELARKIAYKKAQERIESGAFLKTLKEESLNVEKFIKWLQAKRKFTHSKLYNKIFSG